jgi:hypothetical protein
MIAAWIGMALLLQGVPLQPQQGGTITGVLRDAEGKPFPGARVAAVQKPEDSGPIWEAAAMPALAQTDQEGRYRLENIPPGKYYIAAGRVSFPTFFPGTQEVQGATIVAVTAGSNISEIDFRIRDSSVPGLETTTQTVMYTLRIPLDIRVDGIIGAGQVPVFGPRGHPRIALTASGKTTPDSTLTFKGADGIFLHGPTADYKVTLENLPPGYSLKSLFFDNTDLRTKDLHLSAATFAGLTMTSIAHRVYAAVTTALGAPSAIPPSPPPAIVPPMLVVLEKTANVAMPNGVRVTGRAADSSVRQVYMSGVPGIFFWDGSFEFLGVPPGRHTIVAFDATERLPLGASVVVGDRDLEGVRLEPLALLPPGIRTPRAPGPAGAHAPGTTIALATLNGTIVDKESKQPLASGSAFISTGNSVVLDMLDAAGKFSFPGLLPGSYSLEIRLVDHAVEPRTIVIGDENVKVEIAAEKPKD